MVALNNISAVFADIALVLLVILAVFADIALILLVILAVLAVMAVVLLVMLAVLDDIAVVLLVMLAVLDDIALVLLVILAVLADIALVLLVILAVFASIALVLLVILAVLALMAVVLLVILAVLADIAIVLLVILKVFEVINVGNVVIVDESTPPTLFTVGKSAVPPKSFANFNIPFTLAEASGAVELVILAATNAVVANWVEIVPVAAVGAVGVPVNDGDAMVARNNISAMFVVILAVLALMAFVLLVMLAVLALMAFVLLVILKVLEAIRVGNVVIVDEFTPPTLFTVGKSAVPPKSFANFSIPLSVIVALVADIVPPEIDIPKPAVNATCFALNVL
jgi:hypothetical protein